MIFSQTLLPISDRKEKQDSYPNTQPYLPTLKILLSPYKVKARLRVHVTFDMELRAEDLGSTEEDARFSRGVDLADGAKDHVPIWAAEVGGGTETGDSVVVGVGFVDHDVGGVVGFDFGGEVLRMSAQCSSAWVGR